jgi:hypothetical protein
LDRIINLLNVRSVEPKTDKYFTIPADLPSQRAPRPSHSTHQTVIWHGAGQNACLAVDPIDRFGRFCFDTAGLGLDPADVWGLSVSGGMRERW